MNFRCQITLQLKIFRIRAAPAGRPRARLFRLEFGVRGDASGFWVQGRGCLSSNSTSRERARESVRESEREREREKERDAEGV